MDNLLTLGQTSGGTGSLTLSGNHTFAGNLIIDEGRIHLAGGSLASDTIVLGGGLAANTAFNASLEISSGTTFTPDLSVQNFNNNGGARELVFSNPSGTAGLSGNVALDKTLDVSSSGNGAILSGIISGTGGLNKTGNGTLTLSGDNTYTGSTSVSAGTLAVNGDQSSATGDLTVGSTGTLAGNGTVGGATTIEGTLAAGEGGVGTLTFDNTLDFKNGSIFSWELNAGTADPGANTANSGAYDQIIANGNVSGTSTFFVSLLGNAFADSFWETNKTWTDIFSGNGPYNLASIFPAFGGSDLNGILVNSNGTVDNFGRFSFASNTLTWTIIPEPTTALVSLLLTAGLLRRRRA